MRHHAHSCYLYAALHSACLNDNFHVAELLLENGADLTLVIFTILENMYFYVEIKFRIRTAIGESCCFWAYERGLFRNQFSYMYAYISAGNDRILELLRREAIDLVELLPEGVTFTSGSSAAAASGSSGHIMHNNE
jgi:hypothetical protein